MTYSIHEAAHSPLALKHGDGMAPVLLPPSPVAANHARPAAANVTIKEATCSIKEVVLGYTWIRPECSSFYPTEFVGKELERLYVCPWCFKYTPSVALFRGHLEFCDFQDVKKVFEKVVYEKGDLSVLELDGDEFKIYAQNLSLFAKLFLDTKSVFYDVNNFLYYLLVHLDSTAQKPHPQVVGFFSKEKLSWDNNNLACILVFPPWQRRGFGQILMGISYLLSKREKRLGGPEKPLSDLGRKAYIQFWATTLARYLLSLPAKRTKSIIAISNETYITPEDILMTLKEMQVLDIRTKSGSKPTINKVKVKAWTDAHRISLVDPVDLDCFDRLNPTNEDGVEIDDGQDSEPEDRSDDG